jgi:hypothetical protein
VAAGSSPHACAGITQAIADERVPFVYVPRYREWGLLVDGGPAIQSVTHCPWCGSELPESLRDRFFDELDKHGLDVDTPDLPLHLRSDAWWQSGRG